MYDTFSIGILQARSSFQIFCLSSATDITRFLETSAQWLGTSKYVMKLQGAQKEATTKLSKKCFKMRLFFLVKLKYQSSTIILSGSFKYSMHDQFHNVNNYA